MPEAREFHWPYTPSPGGATPAMGEEPEVGHRELVQFFWLAVINTVIIAVVGIVAWAVFH
jgi:hypothetical protein